ncbi:hypothetical protein LX32DRAFT_641161 [Colletotrichum zoysiae]|uniref:Uncharacterized protein n=1 Tax=Colletotrichum zoysiae TaxID=1216348 RepID=A0AAD9M395_9PEZI|nr:hypothetical protein LX32DRAFT_641161 [Colletotrichum zoysiae]
MGDGTDGWNASEGEAHPGPTGSWSQLTGQQRNWAGSGSGSGVPCHPSTYDVTT